MKVKNDIRYEEFLKLYKDEIKLELMTLALQLEGVIKKHAPVGWTAHLGGSFEGQAVDLPTGFKVEVGSPLEYAMYPELGTKPHWAPLQPLIEWVENKLQPHVLAVGINFDSGRALPNKTRKGSKILRGDERKKAILELARKIQFKIAMKGTKPQYYMRDSLTELGLQYALEFTETAATYSIDIAAYLEPKMNEIIARATNKRT